MNIPQSKNLSTQRMSRVFDKTVATYKFYWFMGILDLHIQKHMTLMSIWDVMVEMVVNAWYPVCYFHISFGKSESLYEAIHKLQSEYQIPLNVNSADLRAWLHEHRNEKNVCKILHFLPQYVPYRFLRPWINTNDNKELATRSLEFENGCLYCLTSKNGEDVIELNPIWLDYLKDNYLILKDFSYWNLVLFLQARNPNVPNIPNKLIKSEKRNSLSRQHSYWDFVINHSPEVDCIYTNQKLEAGRYDLDHFIPWSFVSHDLIWNLIPADGSINSSKNDKLPRLDLFLPKLALTHQRAIRIVLENGFHGNILEDYLSLGCTPQEIIEMDQEHLYKCFHQTYSPLQQIALNMGFETWNYE